MALNEDDQMQAVFISSRPVEVDPVSGNDVPPGSLPEEVRDDIPAQLSEGEYVVPADVLRFYGMKFFEDLRKEAKIELARMDAEGRIGGEPMGEMEDDDLTPEEMAEIDSMMMAVGGFATQQPTQSTQPDPYQQQQMMYRQGAPVAMGNAGYAQGGEVRGYQFGGSAAAALGATAMQDTTETPVVEPPATTTPMPMGTQANLDFSQFGAGFSFSPQAQQNLQQLGQQTAPQPEFTPVIMYAPDGTEVEATTLEEYNNYLSQGYTMAPPAVKPSNDDGPPPTETEPKDPTSWADGLDFTDPESIKEQVKSMLELSKGEKAGMTGAISGFGLLGAAGAGAYRATGIARANAMADILEDLYGKEEVEDLRTEINKTIEDSVFLKNLPNEWINGDKIADDLRSKFDTDLRTIAALSMTSEERRSISSSGAAATTGGVYKPQGVDVALGGDDDDPTFTAAVEESRQKAAANRAAMQEAQKSTGGTNDVSELKEAFEEAGGTWATGGR